LAPHRLASFGIEAADKGDERDDQKDTCNLPRSHRRRRVHDQEVHEESDQQQA